jgi:hypothetical protein
MSQENDDESDDRPEQKQFDFFKYNFNPKLGFNFYRDFLYAMRDYDEEEVAPQRRTARGSRMERDTTDVLLLEGRHPDMLRAREKEQEKKEREQEKRDRRKKEMRLRLTSGQ